MAPLTPKEMDAHAAGAAKELAALHRASLVQISQWWNRWYLTAGHKRLGRLIRAHVPPDTKAKDDVAPKQHVPRSSASAVTISDGIEFRFQETALDTPRIVAARHAGAVVNVELNTNHPVHEYLSLIIADTNSSEQVVADLERAKRGLQILLQAWAVYELGEPVGPRRDRAKRAAVDWGRAARRLL